MADFPPSGQGNGRVMPAPTRQGSGSGDPNPKSANGSRLPLSPFKSPPKPFVLNGGDGSVSSGGRDSGGGGMSGGLPPDGPGPDGFEEGM